MCAVCQVCVNDASSGPLHVSCSCPVALLNSEEDEELKFILSLTRVGDVPTFLSIPTHGPSVAYRAHTEFWHQWIMSDGF